MSWASLPLASFLLPQVLLVFTVWLTYWSLLFEAGWVSDDCALSEGKTKPIAVYVGPMQQPLSWHNVFKHVRYFYGRITNSNKRWKEDKQSPFLPSPHAHHRLNVVIFSGLILLLYQFLLTLFPQPLAFLATLLFIVHPLGCQTVGWVSGIGYLVGTFFMLVGLNVVQIAILHHWMNTPMGVIGSLILYGFCQWMAVEAWFVASGATALLVWLHAWPFATIAAMLGVYQCLHTFREAIDYRKRIFHEQQMGQSTKFYPRKVIVVLKTLFYNVRLMVFPKRLGLYHTYFYHYDLPYVEQEDRYFLGGLAVAAALVSGMCVGSPVLSLACLWVGTFLFFFLNWITANQFVVDRYAWLPAFGICLLAAAFLPSWVYWLVFGLALMRTWSHHPTYRDEEWFYRSNIVNFPESEVAYGNLGVISLAQGHIGSALDAWVRGIQRNPDYDVCWYNLASLVLQRGPLHPNYAPHLFNLLPKEVMDNAFLKDPMRSNGYIAAYLMERAVQARTCHYPLPWQQELQRLKEQLARPLAAMQPARLVQPLFTAATT